MVAGGCSEAETPGTESPCKTHPEGMPESMISLRPGYDLRRLQRRCASHGRDVYKLLSHTSNVDFTNSRPQVLREAVLRTVPVNSSDPNSGGAQCRYPR